MRKISLFIAAVCCAVTINATEGALSGKFSVAADKQVVFSQGNLQASTTDLGEHWTWSFAENQWDLINFGGNKVNGNGTVSQNGPVDLFGWSSPATYYGIHKSKIESDYSGEFVDWGTNIISNGGNEANLWRTLTKDEWKFLLHERTNADELLGMGKVDGISGLILLPDDWNLPDAAIFYSAKDSNLVWRPDYDAYMNYGSYCYYHNSYTVEQWSIMESAGAVFLPVAGYRQAASLSGGVNYYWSSSLKTEERAYVMSYSPHTIYPQKDIPLYYGNPVRLVQVYKEPVEDVASYVCDFTKQASSTNQYYNTTWTYDTDWKIFGGSTYYADWDYCKFGGKYSILAEANPVYLANIAPFGNDVRRIKVYIHAGSLGNSEMSVNSWGVEAYSSDDYSEINRLGTVTGSAISNAADTIIIDIDDANSAWWNAGNYLRVFWDLANNSNTPGIIFVDKVEFYTIKDTATDIDNLPSDASNKSDSSTQKILRDGKIHILRGEKIYTLQGQEVK